jgi:phosphoribosyl 1,2-cyclic phosphodiesterase
VRVRFFGVRGSCPCSSDEHRRYGGNTSCVTVEVGDDPPIILDLGTGLRPLGVELLARQATGPARWTALLTHLHWDHLIGLPFFPPVLRPGAHLDVFGPVQTESSIQQVVDTVVKPPFFPVQVGELHGSVAFHDVDHGDLAVGSAKVTVRPVPHVGATIGFRIEGDGAVVAYVSDHQAPVAGDEVADSVLELCAGADVVIHDAQYTADEFTAKADWGHSTPAFAVTVAARAEAGTLALFHHDPLHGDDQLDAMVAEAHRVPGAERLGGVLAAAEGMVLEVAGGDVRVRWPWT